MHKQETPVLVQPYLSFEGRCEEALTFYRDTLGATVEFMMRFKENPEPAPSGGEGCAPGPIDGEKVMHASLRIGDSVLMATDGMCSGKASFAGISLTLNPATTAEAERLFKALADGGQVQMPLAKTFFSPLFGMLVDRFGVSWMVVTETAEAPAA